MPRFKDEAIVVRDLDWSETSQVVVLLTRERGKVRGLAKGSKRMSPSSVQRFSGGIELLTRGQVVAMTRANRPEALATITEWDLIDDAYHLRQRWSAMAKAMYACDLVEALLPEDEPHPATYAAMEVLMDALSGQEGAEAALLAFQWGLLVECGYRPELYVDVHSGEELAFDTAMDDAKAAVYSFDAKAGGMTQQSGLVDWRVRPATLGVLRAVAEGARLEQEEEPTAKRANRLLAAYVRELIGKELSSMSVVMGM